MDDPERVTIPLLDVVEAFWESEGGLHGYEIKKRTKRLGPTVYNNLTRLRKLGWITEVRHEADPGRPQRSIFVLTPEGRAAALDLLIKAGRVHVVRDSAVVSDPGGAV